MATKLPTLYLLPLSRCGKPAPAAGKPNEDATQPANPIEWGYDLVDSSGSVHSTHWNVEGYHPAVVTDVKVEGYHVVQFIGKPTHVDSE